MKIGQSVSVFISSQEVAQAYIEDIEDDVVTLVIPATRVRMGVRSELTDLPETEPAKEHVMMGPETNQEPSTSQAQESVVNTPTQEVQTSLAETGGRSLKEVELDSSVLDD